MEEGALKGGQPARESHGFWSQTWDELHVLPPMSCVILNKLSVLSELQFLYL